MPKIARLGDRVEGFCNGPGHPSGRPFFGFWGSSSPDCFCNSLPIVRVGDTGTTDCGHQFVSVTGSLTVKVNSIAVHRVSDEVRTEGNGVGFTVEGSTNVSSG